jgi:PD-(D/E)XK nuclease superfamily
MNIFQVLSQGKSRLHEPSMSAMLGYLLDSNKDHGLGDAFIRVFLSTIDEDAFKEFLFSNFIKSQVELERPYQLGNNRKDIDIEISLLDEDNKEKHRIIIENKIKVGAANPKQLKEYYEAVLQEDSSIANLYIIFLTPESATTLLKAEYENLNVSNKHHKKWLHWDSSSQKSIIAMVRDVLNLELNGEINPINEYMRHTLKAFIKHSSAVTQSKSRVSEDLGEIVEEEEIKLKNGETYRIVRRDSTQIQVYNVQSGEKEIAWKILAKYIDESGIDISHNGLTTRQIGRKLFDWLKNNPSHE